MKKTSKAVASKAGGLLGGADEVIDKLRTMNRTFSDWNAQLELMQGYIHANQHIVSAAISKLMEAQSLAGHELNDAKRNAESVAASTLAQREKQ
jgi:hypothetical protein